LPDCRGTYGDIPLADEPGENSTWANCKIRPPNADRVWVQIDIIFVYFDINV
jgi:hypothetical protein